MRHRAGGNETKLRGFFLIQNRAAGFADSDTGLDAFSASGTFGRGLRIIKPRLFEFQFAGRAALEIRDEHRIVRAFPFEVGSRYEPAVKFFEFASRFAELGLRRFESRGDEHAVVTSLPR